MALIAVGLGLLAASPSARAVWFGNFWLTLKGHNPDETHEYRVAIMNDVCARGGRVLEIGPGHGINLKMAFDQHAQKELPSLEWEGMEPNHVLFDALNELIAQKKSGMVSGTFSWANLMTVDASNAGL